MNRNAPAAMPAGSNPNKLSVAFVPRAEKRLDAGMRHLDHCMQFTLQITVHANCYLQMLRNFPDGDIGYDNGSFQSCAQRPNLSPSFKKNYVRQHSIRTSPSRQTSGRIRSSWSCCPSSSGADTPLWDARTWAILAVHIAWTDVVAEWCIS